FLQNRIGHHLSMGLQDAGRVAPKNARIILATSSKSAHQTPTRATMHAKSLLHHLIEAAADHDPEAIAVVSGSIRASYGELQTTTARFGAGLVGLGLARGERV